MSASGTTLGGGGASRGAFGHEERAVDLRRIPWHLGALAQFAHAQANAGEQIVERKAAGRDHFRERGRVRAIGTLLVRCDRARRRVEGDRHAVHRIDERQTARQWLTAAREWVLPRRIKDDDLDPAGQRRERLGEIGDAHGLERHIDVALDVGVDRDEIIVPGELQSEAGEINQGDRVGSGSGDLAEKFAKCFAQRRLIQIARAGDGETRRLQCVGDKAGVIGRCRKLGRLIFVVADHQRKPRLRGIAGARRERQRQNSDKPHYRT